MEANKRLIYESPCSNAVIVQAEGVICQSNQSKLMLFGGLNESGVIEQENIVNGGSF
jgi:hypothetical protein